MSQIIASRKVCGGKDTLIQRICPDCHMAFWSGINAQRFRCVDCDPTVAIVNRGIGCCHDRHISDRQYHGSNYDG